MEQDKVSFRGVIRKGAWTEEEDDLLRGCIDKYGQGEWHKVPLRAGLKRCRKSCRLRWLNYLNPSIKRGQFTDDEIDLIVRLHKLLGNRWTLIAGRLPGRTANDVKNYWNTHMVRKIKTRSTSIIRPRPRTISREFTRLKQAELTDPIPQPDDSDKPRPPLMSPENDTGWWESMMPEGGFLGERPESPGSQEGKDGWNEEMSFDIDLWNILSAGQEECTVI